MLKHYERRDCSACSALHTYNSFTGKSDAIWSYLLFISSHAENNVYTGTYFLGIK